MACSMKTFTTNDNIHISYQQYGTGGPIVVLLHGEACEECISCTASAYCTGTLPPTNNAAMHCTGWSGSHRYYDLNIEVHDSHP